MSLTRKIGFAVVATGLVASAIWALWPRPMQVDLAEVTLGPLQGVISAQGVTRVRNPYAITAPITGAVTRSPVEIGDTVVSGETVLAVIQPANPALMDARARAQAEAAVVEAQASVALAETNLLRAETRLDYSARQLERNLLLAERGTIPRRILEDIEADHVSAQQALTAARSELELSRATLTRAQAQFLGPQAVFEFDAAASDCCVQLVAPQDGTVLAVEDRSARLVQAGTPLLTIGHLDDMEIELDLLSTDAVRVPKDARALVDRWGGEHILDARLRRIDPAAFTRVSALGIEEQRVRLRLDLLSPPEKRVGLGDGFRVQVHLLIWEEDAVLQVPQAALFRYRDGWAVFVADEGIARLTPVRIGRQTPESAEVLDGLKVGVQVVLYPGSALQDGLAVVARTE